MPPERWLSTSASVSSLMRSQLCSTADKRCSAWVRNSRSVITIRCMLKVCSILVTRQCLVLCTVALVGCGQKGPLKLPTDDAARGRATVIETLTPDPLRNKKPTPIQPASTGVPT
ncbi:lipoprotein, partial [Limnohabitans sp. Rim8]|uniref:LPS translocon maturation chaperone LptM n=1 Tax=Limnohabitans sp. Rim8 TaxID=1100718 RepID=UPI00345B94A0